MWRRLQLTADGILFFFTFSILEKIDAIISIPSYFGALYYVRDNRLRLWFLGCEDWMALDDERRSRRKTSTTKYDRIFIMKKS